MSNEPTDAGRELPADLERFDFEDDEIFQIAVDLAVIGDDIAMELKADRPWAASQIGRASLSVPANIGEAQGEHSPGDKARFYRYARRSATETAGIVVVLARKALISLAQEIHIRRLLLSAIKAITRRIIHFEGIARARKRGWRDRKY